jgi:hypothetical protein|tara:strand:- start:77 stop:556 length:480 start_codon:yes stop_codon:yes gene_type:complete
MATLTVTINERLLLNNNDYSGKTKLSVTGVSEVVKRIVNIGTDEIGLLGFGTAYNTELSKTYLAGQFDEDDVRYIRITNLDSTNHIALVLKNENNDEFGVKVDKGCSFLYGVDLDGGVVDTMDSADAAGITPDSFGDLVDITCAANTAACDVEVFVASA